MTTKFNDSLIARFSENVLLDLPGYLAQKRMEPKIEGDYSLKRKEKMDYDSAVLVLLEQHKSTFKLCYTLRASHLGNHRGQISFPGGRQESGESPEETALREAYEEISLQPTGIQILGRLSPLNVDRSSHRVTPILAMTAKPPMLKPNPDEVEQVFSISVSTLMDPSTVKYERRRLDGIPFIVPYWDVHRVPLWGVTAMITAELLAIFERGLFTD